MLRGYSFRPRGWALGLAAATCGAGIALGNWQSRRAEEKRDLAAAFDQALKSSPINLPAPRAEVIHKRVAASGHFLPEHTVLLDNKVRRGRPGYEVVTPLRMRNSDVHVLVNRGWRPAPALRETVPVVRTPAGDVRIDGIALDRIAHALAAGESKGRVRQNLDIGAFAGETGLKLEAFVIEQHSDTDDGLIRDWPRPDLGIEKHESYALQWYSFAALAVILALVLSFRRVTSS